MSVSNRATEQLQRLLLLLPPLLLLLWFTSGRCDGFAAPITAAAGCDTGKDHLDRDLPVLGVHCEQPAAARRAFAAQRFQAVDTVFDPEPAAEICMDQSISYNHSVPHSGAYRPVSAQSGEYLYCPPQRWLKNLHGGAATVLLYHPCAAASERKLLSVLARSCLQNYILSPHPQLRTPVTLVSWGRTLELPTAAAAATQLCHWLEATWSTAEKPGGAGRKYKLLLTRPAEQQQQQQQQQQRLSQVGSEGTTANMKEPVRYCCERVLSGRWAEAQQQDRDSEGPRRQRRSAASGESTQSSRRRSRSSSPAGPGTSAQLLLQTPLPPSEAPVRDRTPPTRPPTPLGAGESTTAPPGSHQRSVDGRDGGDNDSRTKATGAVEVKQRELVGRSTSSLPDLRGVPGVQLQAATQPAGRQHCGPGPCQSGVGAEVQGGVKVRAGAGPLRTPRTNEAVWAAAALGFLLVLLALSVLHTRLYRHWRTPPSLYWHDPQQDYDSVADVIRRRLHMAKRRRRKRSRRQEFALLPSSSSSDEFL